MPVWTHHTKCFKAWFKFSIARKNGRENFEHSPPRSVIAFEQASINDNVSSGVNRRVQIESSDLAASGSNDATKESPFLSMVPGRRRVRCGASVVGQDGCGFDLDLNKPNGRPLSPCTSSGNLGLDGEMVEGTASNFPSRSEGSEERLTERGVESFSSPFLRPKTFDKNEGIATCPVAIDLREGGPRRVSLLEQRFLGLLRHHAGG